MNSYLPNANSHTLVLIQQTNKSSSRSYLECKTAHDAAKEVIDIFEAKVRSEQSLQSLSYTNLDVLAFIESLHEFACLVREQVTPNSFAYVPKDAGWIKPFIDAVLQQKVEATTDLYSTRPSTLTSRLSNPEQPQSSKQRSRGPAAPKLFTTSSTLKKTGRILVAANPSKVTKRPVVKPAPPPTSAKSASNSTQLFTAAYAERMNIAHVVPFVNASPKEGKRNRRRY